MSVINKWKSTAVSPPKVVYNQYHDTETGRKVVVGRHDKQLIMMPYEINEIGTTPITVHATSRQQINFRLKSGRFIHE